MTVTKKDLILAGCFVIAGVIIGFGIGWKAKPVQVINEDDKYKKFYQQIDSLKLLVKDNNKDIDTIYSQIKTIDINRNNNFKNLANELKQVRRFTTTTRSKYLDSLAAVEGL